MKEPYLQVTYRRGRPYIAYLYLPRKKGEKSYETELVEPGMVLDFNREGKLIGHRAGRTRAGDSRRSQ